MKYILAVCGRPMLQAPSANGSSRKKAESLEGDEVGASTKLRFFSELKTGRQTGEVKSEDLKKWELKLGEAFRSIRLCAPGAMEGTDAKAQAPHGLWSRTDMFSLTWNFQLRKG